MSEKEIQDDILGWSKLYCHIINYLLLVVKYAACHTVLCI